MASPSLIQHHAAASISLAMAHPAVASASSSDGGATISANDFLTLLVTEMQNQDPTADTDPNEYINQLVNVNSLEQLIQINQTLSSAAPTPSSGASPVSGLVYSTNQADAHAPSSLSTPPTQLHPAPATGASPQSLALSGLPAPATVPVESGNLSVPSASPAALRVGRALGSSRTRP